MESSTSSIQSTRSKASNEACKCVAHNKSSYNGTPTNSNQKVRIKTTNQIVNKKNNNNNKVVLLCVESANNTEQNDTWNQNSQLVARANKSRKSDEVWGCSKHISMNLFRRNEKVQVTKPNIKWENEVVDGVAPIFFLLISIQIRQQRHGPPNHHL